MSSSRLRSALAKACWKVRPMAIASPTDFMCVDRSEVHAGELLEGEARPLDHHVVDRRLEARGRDLGDVVGDLLQRVADGQARGDLGDREAGRLGGQRARARDARVHLDDEDLLAHRVDGELDVGAAGLDADGADDGDGLVAQALVEAVGERLLGRHGHAVAGVHAHRVDVLDRADDHDVVVQVAHDLELELAPAEDRLVEQDLADGRRRQPALDDALVLLLGAGDAAAAPAEGEGRAHDARQPDVGRAPPRASASEVAIALRGIFSPAPLHRLAEEVAVLGARDGVVVGADELDPEALEGPVLVQRLGQVQRRLAAEGRQQRVGALALDDLRQRPGQQRLDVGRRRRTRGRS